MGRGLLFLILIVVVVILRLLYIRSWFLHGLFESVIGQGCSYASTVF